MVACAFEVNPQSSCFFRFFRVPIVVFRFIGRSRYTSLLAGCLHMHLLSACKQIKNCRLTAEDSYDIKEAA
jgi:hypothetical protein